MRDQANDTAPMASLPPQLAAEMWPVGRHSAVFSSQTRAVALVNETAAAVWRLLADTQDARAVSAECSAMWNLDPDEAGRMVGALIADWQRAGLIARSNVAIGPAGGIALQACPPAAIDPSRDAGVYATLAGRFRVACEDPIVAVIMAAVLGPLAGSPGSDARESRIEILGQSNRCYTTRDGVVLIDPGNISFARHEALKQLLIDPNAPELSSAILHAAAVAIGGRAVIIAGDCGRGKSTLTACLVQDGARYVGDDLLPLDRSGAWLGVCPVGLSVKIGSWGVVRPLFSPRLWSDEITINNYRVRYVDLSHRAPLVSRVPIGAIVFPNYSAGAAFSAEAIEPERSLQILLQSGSRTAGPVHSMEGLCRLADRTSAWKLTYSDWRDAARFIADHPEDRRS